MFGRLTNFNDNIQYAYNADGIRISKTIKKAQKDEAGEILCDEDGNVIYSDVETKFILNGNKIICSVDNGVSTWYNYDSNGIVGFTHIGTEYIYVGVAVIAAASVVACVFTGGTSLVAAAVAIGGLTSAIVNVASQVSDKGWQGLDVG